MRLKSLVVHAYDNVAYYRRLFDSVGFRPRHLKNPSDIQAIPVTTRQTLKEVPRAELISRGFDPASLRESQTSGSTGAPLKIYRAHHEGQLRRLLTLRTFLHHGLRWNDRVLTVSRAPSTPVSERRLDRYRRRWNVSFFDDPERQLESFLKFRPTVFYGYAPSVAIVGSLLLKHGSNGFPLRVVATSAEMVTPGFRRTIRKAFGVEPLDIYNCTELGDIAWQCHQRSGLHINADWLNVEIVGHNQVLPAGESGDVVVTSLYRYAMPLIRYSPGDFASMSDAPCSCGLTLPTLDRLDGRSQQLVTLPNGRLFIGFSRIMSDFPEIARYQIHQLALNHFLINVVPGSEFSPELLARVIKACQEKLGGNVRVEARAVDAGELVLGPGKFRYLIALAPVELGDDS